MLDAMTVCIGICTSGGVFCGTVGVGGSGPCGIVDGVTTNTPGFPYKSFAATPILEREDGGAIFTVQLLGATKRRNWMRVMSVSV